MLYLVLDKLLISLKKKLALSTFFMQDIILKSMETVVLTGK